MTSESCSFVEVRNPPTTARPRLLLVSTNMGMGGGAEDQVLRLAYGFRSRGWEALIVSMLPPKRMPPDFEGREVAMVSLSMRRGIPDPRGVRRLSRLIRDFRPDIVHSHMVHANLLARAARLVEPYPALVCTHHNLTMAGVKRDLTSVFEVAHRLTDALAEHSTAICHAASDYYIRRGAVPASKMSVIPNGIDVDAFRRDPSERARTRRELGLTDEFVWLAAGRLEVAKAYPTMLRAFATLGEGRRTLLICGQGSLRDDLEAVARDLGVGERVRFLGLRDDIPALMSAADGFALSSDLEGLPLVLLQASAASLPIVATDVGGNAEAVVEGVNGYRVPSGDPGAFSRAMARVESMPSAARASLGEAGRARTREVFEVERVVDRWERLYFELIRRAGGPRRLARVATADESEMLRDHDDPKFPSEDDDVSRSS